MPKGESKLTFAAVFSQRNTPLISDLYFCDGCCCVDLLTKQRADSTGGKIISNTGVSKLISLLSIKRTM